MKADLLLAILSATILSILSGCAATRALQRETIHQSNTISEIHQQQVLNNLAKFVRDPNALPDFAWPKEGSAQITDHCEGNGNVGWDAAGFASAAVAGIFSREKQDAWTLEPINDPRKLELMRCAYQKAVANCSIYGPSYSCPNCNAQMQAFYGAEPGSAALSNIASYDCVNPGCCTWFAYGPKERVPKCCRHVGHYCGTFVWILPGGEDQFTKLTLAILDYAMNDFPDQQTMDVTLYRKEALDSKNNRVLIAANSDDATEVVTARVPINTDLSQSLGAPSLFGPPVTSTNEKAAMRGQPPSGLQAPAESTAPPPSQYLPRQRTQPNSGLDTLQLRMRLNALAPGSR